MLGVRGGTQRCKAAKPEGTWSRLTLVPWCLGVGCQKGLPALVAGVDDWLAEEGIEPRFPWRVEKLHPRLLRRATPFATIAAEAAADDILPRRLTP